MDPLIITVAGVGAELTREQQPNLPLTAEDVGRDAAEVAEAGASIYHLHVRDQNGEPTMDVETYRAAHDAIRSKTDLIVQFSSGGAVGDDEDGAHRPPRTSSGDGHLTTGTVNFGDEVFMNPASLVDRFYARMRELGIVPEFEIFDAGMIANAETVYAEQRRRHHRHYDFVLGVPGGMPAWPDSIDFLAAHLPEKATWSATGIGTQPREVMREAIELGGHVRTGFEDVRYIGPGRTGRVEPPARVGGSRGGPKCGRARRLCRTQARALLGLG